MLITNLSIHDFSLLQEVACGELHPARLNSVTKEILDDCAYHPKLMLSVLFESLSITITQDDGLPAKDEFTGVSLRPDSYIDKQTGPFSPLTIAYDHMLLSEMNRLWKSWLNLLLIVEKPSTQYKAQLFVKAIERFMSQAHQELPVGLRNPGPDIYPGSNSPNLLELAHSGTSENEKAAVFVFRRLRLHLFALLTAMYYSTQQALKDSFPEWMDGLLHPPEIIYPLVLFIPAPAKLPDFGLMLNNTCVVSVKCVNPDCSHKYISFDKALIKFEVETGIKESITGLRPLFKTYACDILEKSRQTRSVSECDFHRMVSQFKKEHRKRA